MERSLDFPAKIEREKNIYMSYVSYWFYRMVLWNAQSTYKVTTHCNKKKFSIEKSLFSLLVRSFAIECAILQMLFAVCKKSARCERCVSEERERRTRNRAFLYEQEEVEKREEKIELFSVVMCYVLEMLFFIAFYFFSLSRHETQEKKKNDHAQWRSFIFFSSFDTHKKKYTNMWVVVASEWGRRKVRLCRLSLCWKSFMRTKTNHEMPTGVSIESRKVLLFSDWFLTEFLA